MIKKKNIYIDRFQQQKENNMSLLDYPVFNVETGRQLKHRFGYYFKNMDEYYISKNPEFKKWSKKYKHTSYKAYKLYDDVEHKEYRF